MLFQTFNDNANKYSESFMNLKYTQISNLQPDLSFFFFYLFGLLEIKPNMNQLQMFGGYFKLPQIYVPVHGCLY